MGEHTFNIDTLDVMVISLGVLVALGILPEGAVLMTEKVVVAACLTLSLTLKRLLIPTARSSPESSLLSRMLFLFFSITGTLSTFAGVALTFLEAPEAELRRPGWPEGRLVQVLLVSGFGLLGTSVLLDRLFLRRSP
jgi:hypothetical protein